MQRNLHRRSSHIVYTVDSLFNVSNYYSRKIAKSNPRGFKNLGVFSESFELNEILTKFGARKFLFSRFYTNNIHRVIRY